MARSKKVNNLKESKPQQEEGVHHRGTTKATNPEIKKSPEKQRIGDYDECPSYVQQGNHLDTGYRLGYTKKRQFLFRYLFPFFLAAWFSFIFHEKCFVVCFFLLKPFLTPDSIFQIHNETLNIWTHMIGGFIFIGIIVYVALAFAGASLDHVKQAFAYRVDPELLMNSIRSQIKETVSSLEGLKYTLEEQNIE